MKRYDVILRNSAGLTVHITHLWLDNDKQALGMALIIAAHRLSTTQDNMRYSVRDQIVTVEEGG